MKTVIVTGAAGFIGSHLCEKLLREGWSVAGIDNFNDYYSPAVKRANAAAVCRTAQTLKAAFSMEEGDILDPDFVSGVFKKHAPRAVIHLAAYAGVRPSIQNPVLYSKVNVDGLLNVLEAARSQKVRNFVFASSSSVYGNNKKVPFSEDDFVDRPISPYAATKKAGELICHTYHHLFDINIACLRFFTVYGPRQRPDLAIHKFTKMISEGTPIPFYGDGASRRDYTYIDDTLDGVTKALAWASSPEKRFEVFNLGESHTITLSDLVAEIEKAVGKKAVLTRLPMQPGDVDCTYADVSKARRLLNYDPKTKFEDGIRLFVEWYRQQSASDCGAQR